MTLQLTPSTIPSLVAAAVLIVAALYVRSRWSVWPRFRAARTGQLLLLAAAEWMLCAALGQASVDLSTKVFWDKLQYVGIVIVPTMWLIFTLQYIGRDKWLTGRTLVLLGIVPLITLLLVFSNEAHGLIWTHLVLDSNLPVPVLDKEYGVGFWLYVSYSYVLVLLAIWLLSQMLLRSRELYRWQARALLLAMVGPWLLSALDVLKLNPFPQFDPTALGLAMAGPILAWSLRRLRAGDIVPVAREFTIEAMGDGVIVLDQQDRIVDLNTVAEQLIGRRLEAAVGQPIQEIRPDWRDWLEETYHETEISKEALLSTGDRQRTYDIRISPLLDWRGDLTSRVIVLRDITERKQLEVQATLREAMAVISSTLDLPTVLARIAEQMCISVNATSAYIASYDAETNTSNTLAEYLGPEACTEERVPDFGINYDEVDQEFLAAMQANRHYVDQIGDADLPEIDRAYMMQYGAKSILYVPLWMREQILGYAEVWETRRRREFTVEEIALCQSIAQSAAIAVENARLYETARQEIAERERAEEALEKAKDELETIVEERTSELSTANERLRQEIAERSRAQAQLIQAAKLSAIGQMISGVAHELNNPLTTVMGYAQLLKTSDVDEGLKEDLSRIYHDAVRAQRIVQNLLTFARQKKPQQTPMDINDIIESTLALRSYQLQVDNVEVVPELADNLPWTMADASQLQQVFLNIINNAHQAMAEETGRGVLTVRTELMKDDIIRISFSDTGPGIAPEILGKIFDPFFTTREVGAGTGLGLSVSHGIVQEHGGRIWAESEPGHGATFVVELPVIGWVEDVTQPPPTDKLSRTPTQGRRILVIDDEQSIVDLMVQMLEASGYQVDGVGGAQSALEKLRHQPYDLIICDIKMPGMDGPACAEQVRAIDPELAKRIIFITGDVLSRTTQAFLKGWRGTCIEKPFDLEQVKAAVVEGLS